ncbi:MAG: hypothetical protein ACP5J4_13665 [Anaerolineae bacterium]
MITLGDITLAQQWSKLRLEEIERANWRPIALFGGGSAPLAKVVSRVLTTKSFQKKPKRLVGAPGKPTVPGLCDAEA